MRRIILSAFAALLPVFIGASDAWAHAPKEPEPAREDEYEIRVYMPYRLLKPKLCLAPSRARHAARRSRGEALVSPITSVSLVTTRERSTFEVGQRSRSARSTNRVSRIAKGSPRGAVQGVRFVTFYTGLDQSQNVGSDILGQPMPDGHNQPEAGVFDVKCGQGVGKCLLMSL
jgi:hypothetical protein